MSVDEHVKIICKRKKKKPENKVKQRQPYENVWNRWTKVWFDPIVDVQINFDSFFISLPDCFFCGDFKRVNLL